MERKGYDDDDDDDFERMRLDNDDGDYKVMRLSTSLAPICTQVDTQNRLDKWIEGCKADLDSLEARHDKNLQVRQKHAETIGLLFGPSHTTA